MTLTDAQKRALEQLPVTFDANQPETTDGIQWRTIEKLHGEGLVTYSHRGMGDESRDHVIEVNRVPGEGRDS